MPRHKLPALLHCVFVGGKESGCDALSRCGWIAVGSTRLLCARTAAGEGDNMKRILTGIAIALLVAGCGSVQTSPEEEQRFRPMALVSSGDTIRASVSSAGTQSAGASQAPSISDDGRYVAFHSTATDLVGGDTNDAGDVFVHDHDTGDTTRVSVDSNGNEGNSNSLFPSISGDGRYVAFESESYSLVSDDTNSAMDGVLNRSSQQSQHTLRPVTSIPRFLLAVG